MFRALLAGLVAMLVSTGAGTRFTPEDLLSSPRQGSFVANKAGNLVIYKSSTYSFKDHNTTTSWKVLHTGWGTSRTIDETNKASNAIWLGTDDKTLLYTKPIDSGETEFWIATYSDTNAIDAYQVATFPGPVSGVKVAVKDQSVRLLVAATANPDGSIHNPKTAPKKYTSGLVYDQLFVRHWDSYIVPQTSTLFSNTLHLQGDKYVLASSDYTNLLVGDQETPVPPFGGSSDFDISSDGELVVFVSKDKSGNTALHTASHVFHVSFDKSMPPSPINAPDGVDVNGKPLAKGSSASPVFSPNGSIAFLQMYEDGYESDQNKIFIANKRAITPLLADWDVSPSELVWSPKGDELYIIAQNNGREKLYKVNVDSEELEELISERSVQSVATMPDNRLVLGINSIKSSTSPFIYDPADRSLKALEGDDIKQYSVGSIVEDITFLGHDVKVHGFVIKPSFFDKSKKYPLAYFIHGGPQGAWTDAWSTRWNPAVFAEQGYVVVAVNPTGSTGYGQKFVDAIQGEWGGKPYEDLAKGIDYLMENEDYSYINFDRMVALGASYGGYMVNWIQGMPLGRKFKALVCHDGVYSTLNQYSSEELWFPHHDFEGNIWENRAAYEKWDPAQKSHLENWATPQMVIHNAKDFRLPISEGVAAFNVLQVKGIPSKFLTFPDENHWVLNPENSLMWHDEIFKWIKQWAPPTTEDEAPSHGKQSQVVIGHEL